MCEFAFTKFGSSVKRRLYRGRIIASFALSTEVPGVNVGRISYCCLTDDLYSPGFSTIGANVISSFVQPHRKDTITIGQQRQQDCPPGFGRPESVSACTSRNRDDRHSNVWLWATGPVDHHIRVLDTRHYASLGK